MDDWSSDDEIEWLTSEYTCKKYNLRRTLENLEGRAEF
jgi:hypothetical protein